MATAITFDLADDEEIKSPIENEIEHRHLLRPPTHHYKPLPLSIIKSIENDRRQQQQRRIPISHSTSDVLAVKRPSIDTTKDDIRVNNQKKVAKSILHKNFHRLKVLSRTNRTPSETRISVYVNEHADFDENLNKSHLGVSIPRSQNELGSSDPSLLDVKPLRQNRVDHVRRAILEHKFGRRIHSSFSSSTTLRSVGRRRSTQNLPSRTRRNIIHLPRNSKWHIVRRRLNDIAMMSESYARMKLIEQDLRWINLRETVRAQVLDMREMSLLRQQEDGLKSKKKSYKSKVDLKMIPIDEVVHVERDGRVHSMSTRDLVLGRLLCDEDIELDTFAQLDARRQFQIQQHLVKQQEGRTRLKKHIAFSFCLCNLSFIVLMFAAMLIFATKTILQLRF